MKKHKEKKEVKQESLHSHEHLHTHSPKESCCSLEPKKLGITLGILFALKLSLLVLMNLLFKGWGNALINIMSNLFLGYEASLKGLFIGLIWGFFDGFVLGYLFAIIYNFVKEKKCC